MSNREGAKIWGQEETASSDVGLALGGTVGVGIGKLS